ncbi:MAG: YbaB/EbfC family nucleoid-associated protein [Acidobacteriota bacterium]
MNIAKMLQQAQRAQEQIQRSLAELEVEGSAGGGMVKVRLTGLKELKGVTIDPGALEGGDPGLLEDLVVAAWEEASRQVEERSKEVLAKVGLPAGLPGMF